MPPNPPTDGETPPNPSTEGKCPHNILISLKHSNAQGGTPIQGWCKEVSQHKGEHITTPYNMQSLQKHTDAQKSMGAYRGVYTPGGVQMYGGVQMWGHPDTPKV